jgi:ABC-type spermidine/putrescine transport system permease subunit I
VPLIAPALAASAIFAFSWSFNNFTISYFTAGFQSTFPIWVFSTLNHAKNVPIVNAISTLVAAVQVVILYGRVAAQQTLAGAHGRRDVDAGDGDLSMHEVLDQEPKVRRRSHQRGPDHRVRDQPVVVSWCSSSGPMAVLGYMSFLKFGIAGVGGYTGFDNYHEVLTDPTFWEVLWTTFTIATVAMIVMLVFALPLASVLAFKVKRYELRAPVAAGARRPAQPADPRLRVADPARQERDHQHDARVPGLINQPIASLLFSKTAVVIVTSAEYLAIATIPIYAALKAVDPSMLEAANDLGAGTFTRYRKILIPLAAPGIFVALILVYIPLFTEFLTPASGRRDERVHDRELHRAADPEDGELGGRVGDELPVADLLGGLRGHHVSPGTDRPVADGHDE